MWVMYFHYILSFHCTSRLTVYFDYYKQHCSKVSRDVSLTCTMTLNTYPIGGMLYCDTVLVYFGILYTVFHSDCTG